jgi:BirA family biotin operon repressor/biotin-[acetyl-CoA-carboxylase] ligase
MEIVRLTDTTSTNDYLLGMDTSREVCVVADYQSAGKGMDANTWESEAGKNLLFSILVHPVWLPIAEQYLMSMAEALALHDVLSQVLQPLLGTEVQKKLCIKWPNDIYWENRKLSGTRIDGSIRGALLQDLIIGTGINVNQRHFRGTAPNPVSLYQITEEQGKEQEFDLDDILQKILLRFAHYEELLRRGEQETVIKQYHERLYRRMGYHKYEDADGEFEAELVGVAPNGMMTLKRRDGSLQTFEFKQVRFVIAQA